MWRSAVSSYSCLAYAYNDLRTMGRALRNTHGWADWLPARRSGILDGLLLWNIMLMVKLLLPFLNFLMLTFQRVAATTSYNG